MNEFVIENGILISYNGNDSCVQIPQTVLEIAKHAFYDCSSLEKVELPSSLQKIKEYAFRKCKGIKSIEIPSGVDEIGKYSFSECASLKEIKIPSKVKEIQDFSFSACISLTNIEISNVVEKIGESAFSGCLALESLEIPSSVVYIAPNSFRGCKSLVNLRYITKDDNVGAWWTERFGEVATTICALKYYDASAKVVKYVLRNKKKCIDILVKYKKEELINELLKKSALIPLDDLNDLIEYASKHNNAKINTALLEYKANHYNK